MSSRMFQTRDARTIWQLAAIAATAAVVALPTPATAQNAIMLVNGEPITAYDIEQRSKFHQLVSQ
jgi:peptidyl-prolyl cis-trans isomerase SurA